VNAGASWPGPKVAEVRVLGIQRKLQQVGLEGLIAR
jgi:hypothetical protein